MYRYSPVIVQLLAAAIFLGAAPRLQASSGTAYVSICCNAPSTVGEFNAATLAPSGLIKTGSGGDGIALSPDGTKMFVTVDYKSELQVISTATGAILARVPVPLSISGEPPLEVVASPDGSTVYVLAPQARPNALLLAVDTTTYKVRQTASIPNLASLGPLLISPDGTELYFEVGYGDEYIQVVATATLALLKQIPVNEYPSDLAVTPSGLILMTDTNDQLLVIDPASSTVNVLALPNDNQGTPGAVVSSPDGTTAYVAYATGSILAVRIDTGATVFKASINYVPTHFAISPDGNSLYSTNRSSAGAWSLSVFGIPSQTLITTVPQLGPISGLVLTKNGGTLYVLNSNESGIASVDVASQKVTQVALGGVGINSLAIPQGGTAVWASQYSFGLGGDLLFLNPATNQLKYIPGISGALTFSPDGTVLYTCNPGGVTAYEVASRTPIGAASAGQLSNIVQAVPSPDGTRLYLSVSFVSGVVNHGGEYFSPGEILVLDTSTFKYTAAISIPAGMGPMALTPDGSTLIYATNFGRLQLLSTGKYALLGTVHLAPSNGLLDGLALSPDGSTAYVTDGVNNLLLVANLTTQTQLASIPIGSNPSPIAISPDGSEAWVATVSGLEVVNIATGQVTSVSLPGEPSAIVFGPD